MEVPFKQLGGWRPGCQKWQPEVNIFSLSLLRLDKYATFDILKFSIIASLARNTSARGLLLTWDKRNSPKHTTFSSARVKMWEKHLRHAFLKINNQIKCDGTSVMHIPSWCFVNLHYWCLLFLLSLSSWSIKLLRFENWNFPRVKKIAKCKPLTCFLFSHFDACIETCTLLGRVAFVWSEQ